MHTLILFTKSVTERCETRDSIVLFARNLGVLTPQNSPNESRFSVIQMMSKRVHGYHTSIKAIETKANYYVYSLYNS